MLVIFPSDTFETHKADPDYVEELRVAQEFGHDTILMHYESLVNDDDAAAAVKKCPNFEEPRPAIYRGWMLTSEQYEKFYDALQPCGIDLVTTPEQYRNAHHLPHWIDTLKGYTVPTSVIPKREDGTVAKKEVVAAAHQMLEKYTDGIIIKDYVKSRKHEWEEACFIPDGAKAGEVVTNFLERQGEDLQGGVVLRAFEPLLSIGKHPQSGMPMSEEVRIFWTRGQPTVVAEYWPAEHYEESVEAMLETLPDPHSLAEIAVKIDNPFITMDLARAEDGEWFIMEVGDGQVSGFPRGRADAQILYGRIDGQMGLGRGIREDAEPITQTEFDSMSCSDSGCDHKGHSNKMAIHPKCHVGTPTWVFYENGVLNIRCAECDTLVVRIAVDPGNVTKH